MGERKEREHHDRQKRKSKALTITYSIIDKYIDSSSLNQEVVGSVISIHGSSDNQVIVTETEGQFSINGSYMYVCISIQKTKRVLNVLF